jgi:hypothetical protein
VSRSARRRHRRQGRRRSLEDRRKLVANDIAVEVAEPVARASERVTFRLVIRYQGAATIRQGKTVIRGDCVIESEDNQLPEPDLPWSGRFHDPAAAATLEEAHAWLRLDVEPVREGAINITRSGSGAGAGLIDFDGIGSLRELR